MTINGWPRSSSVTVVRKTRSAIRSTPGRASRNPPLDALSGVNDRTGADLGRRWSCALGAPSGDSGFRDAEFLRQFRWGHEALLRRWDADRMRGLRMGRWSVHGVSERNKSRSFRLRKTHVWRADVRRKTRRGCRKDPTGGEGGGPRIGARRLTAPEGPARRGAEASEYVAEDREPAAPEFTPRAEEGASEKEAGGITACPRA